MIRLGLCCLFKNQPIRFRRTTASHLKKFDREEQLDRLSAIAIDNANALFQAICFCHETGIGSFRVNSQILPLMTHPEAGYQIDDLPLSDQIVNRFRMCGELARSRNIRLTFHPDQFVFLSSPNPIVTKNSIAELDYQAQVAQWIHADVINIHGGGMYGDKSQALLRLEKELLSLKEVIRSRLTLENDDRVYTPSDLLPVCRKLGIPLVYDAHHHRVNPDRLSMVDATALARETWDREPLFHISSPINGWRGKELRKHHDFIDPADFPEYWRDFDLTVDVEAKAKEEAVLKLRKDLSLE